MAHHARTRDAVDRRVVHLHEDCDTSIGEPLDHPQFPQGQVSAHRSAGYVTDDVGQRPFVTRRLKDNTMEMAIDVEVRIIDPEGPAQVERRPCQLLANRGNLGQALVSHGTDALVRVAGRHRGRIEEQESADMQVHGWRFAVETPRRALQVVPLARLDPSTRENRRLETEQVALFE